MTEHYAVEVALPSSSGVPADTVVNTWSFQTAAPADGTALSAMCADLAQFYSTLVTGQANPVGYRLSQELSRGANAVSCKVYHRPAVRGPLGSPIHVEGFTLAASAGNGALPGQDAICLSFHADLTNVPVVGGADANIPTGDFAVDEGAPAVHAGQDRPAERLRGRVFLGPLDRGASSGGANGEARVPSVVRADIAAAAHAILVTEAGAAQKWEVWSDRAWSGAVVVGGWVDDRFDTQRRRLEKATTRTTFGP